MSLAAGDYDGKAGLLPALRIQWRVLVGLFLREAEARRGRTFALGFAASALEPLIIIGAITTLFYLVNRQAGYGSSMLVFVGTGVFPVYLFIHTSMKIREPMAGGTVGRFPVETPIDHVIVHAFLHLITSVSVAVLFFGGVYIYADQPLAIPFDIPNAMAALGAVFLLGLAMGIFNSVLARMIPFWNTAWPGIARAAIHFSGMYFVADYLPPVERKYFALNPILHGVSWFRSAFYPTYPKVLNDHGYILMMSLIAVTLGLLMERQFRRLMAEEDV